MAEISKAQTMTMYYGYRYIDNPTGRELKEFRGNEPLVLDEPIEKTSLLEVVMLQLNPAEYARQQDLINQASKCGSKWHTE